MTKANRVQLLRVSMICTDEEVAAELRDQRPDGVALLLELDDIARLGPPTLWAQSQFDARRPGEEKDTKREDDGLGLAECCGEWPPR